MLKLVESIIGAERTENKSEINIELKKYAQRVKEKIGEKREIMYSDIINLISKEGIKRENATKLIRWCGNQIKKGNDFIDFI